ncbi:phosphonate metabolism transcriptional regulator PhnF [Frondihabitans sucicola]|uniref:Phosphonate metabolism transcriptional regulator PhnF n=1 Tax=Frondihabitans sucicola TaxID=1268041 RepID=A0ABM8GSI3_9MICO|nr:phosphonate metabolism transcriptional regulator PhnF [Frondihabitans sucicola]BDZ51421.1 phosphonate metabolism transcriptional regulator PhnF [Frondihabitans sucicola]
MTTQSRSPSGYSAWRLIADALRGDIVGGVVAPGSKLPSESELAARFDVHRHTVRQAVASLAADHLVVARRGSGTFVAEHTVLVHRIGLRTRLTDSLGPRGGAASGRLLESAVEADPPREVAERLQLAGRAALRLEIVRSVDGLPIARGTAWLDDERVPGLADHFGRDGSITAALRATGIDDYVRVSTTVSGRTATTNEAEDLALPTGSMLLVVKALNTLPDGTPLLYNVTRFAADRVELDVEHAASVS